MIVAAALEVLFDGMAITYNSTQQSVNFGYGDQLELLAWIRDKDKGKKRKYPLVWYIINKHPEEHKGFINVDATLVILQNTESNWFNPTRQSESYTKIIEPTWQEVKKKLTTSQFVQILGDLPTRFMIYDVPKYGVDKENKDLATSAVGKNIVTDITDAREVKFRLRIKANCLI